MPLTPHRKQKIYIAATMGYGLGSDDLEEIKEDKKNGHMGVIRED